MVSTLRRERHKIERNLSGIREMTSIPGAMVVVDPGREANAVREARRLGLPVIGILDTDCDPEMCATSSSPGNDDALKSVRLLIERLVEAVEEGCANRREQIVAVSEKDKQPDLAAADGEPRPTRGNKPPVTLRPRQKEPARRPRPIPRKPRRRHRPRRLHPPRSPSTWLPRRPRASPPKNDAAVRAPARDRGSTKRCARRGAVRAATATFQASRYPVRNP